MHLQLACRATDTSPFSGISQHNQDSAVSGKLSVCPSEFIQMLGNPEGEKVREECGNEVKLTAVLERDGMGKLVAEEKGDRAD